MKLSHLTAFKVDMAACEIGQFGRCLSDYLGTFN